METSPVVYDALAPTALEHPVTPLDPEPTVGDLVSAYLVRVLAGLEDHEVRLRGGDPDGVHQLRVHARRLRAALATYAPIFRPGSTREPRADLRWFGVALGAARDAEVLRLRLHELVAALPPEQVRGPVLVRIDDELGARFRAGRADADEALGGERHDRLLDRLGAFVTEPPFTDAAAAPARRVVPGLLAADLTRLRRRHRAALGAPDRDLALHEVRKSAKRLRYAAETAEPVFGERARDLAAGAEGIQDLLGDHQDSVVARRTLREIAAEAELAGEDGFTYGGLQALEEARFDDLEDRLAPLLARLPAGRLRAWTER